MGHDEHKHKHKHEHQHEHGHEREHSRAAAEHKAHAPAKVATYVVTCSDSRSLAQDETGELIAQALGRAGHPVAGRKVVRDEPSAIHAALEEAQATGARAVIFNGGTGMGRRDQTFETLRPLFEKELLGFGELFRALSFREIGSPAMLSRATAGSFQGIMLFLLPGSPQAAGLAMERLILPELGHLVRELAR
jgi:molybdenum cofactor biosynthesis protein B